MGPHGAVLGIERDDVITDKARLRVANEGLTRNVSFQVANLDEFHPDGLADAVIGRYVLLYQEDPAAILRHYAQFLRPGGVVIFHELDIANTRTSWPVCPVWDELYQLLTSAFLASRAVPDFGRMLTKTYLTARLPLPTVEAITPVVSGPESPVLDWIARTLRSLGPVLDRIGATLPTGLDFDNLAAPGLCSPSGP